MRPSTIPSNLSVSCGPTSPILRAAGRDGPRALGPVGAPRSRHAGDGDRRLDGVPFRARCCSSCGWRRPSGAGVGAIGRCSFHAVVASALVPRPRSRSVGSSGVCGTTSCCGNGGRRRRSWSRLATLGAGAGLPVARCPTCDRAGAYITWAPSSRWQSSGAGRPARRVRIHRRRHPHRSPHPGLSRTLGDLIPSVVRRLPRMVATTSPGRTPSSRA